MGRQAEQSDWLDHAVRAGLVAYGVVHLLIGWLAVQLALGDRSEKASTKGALAELAQQPFGRRWCGRSRSGCSCWSSGG